MVVTDVVVIVNDDCDPFMFVVVADDLALEDNIRDEVSVLVVLGAVVVSVVVVVVIVVVLVLDTGLV